MRQLPECNRSGRSRAADLTIFQHDSRRRQQSKGHRNVGLWPQLTPDLPEYMNKAEIYLECGVWLCGAVIVRRVSQWPDQGMPGAEWRRKAVWPGDKSCCHVRLRKTHYHTQ